VRSASHITTAEQLFRAGDIGRCQLIRGELVMMSPAGGEHALLVATLARALQSYAQARGLGLVLAGDPGFFVERDPDTVLAPDVAFIAVERVSIARPRRFIEHAPDLAVEVMSPSERKRAVERKAADWLAAGAREVWVVDPERRCVVIYSPGAAPDVRRAGDDVGSAVVSGFTMPVATLFADLDG
jgi:Uma2 family endonuclease